MTDELKPCPGCNSHVGITHECTIGTPQYRIKCGMCRIQTGLGDKKHIIRVWNTRNEPDTLPSWAIEAINNLINSCNIKNEEYALGYLAALDDVLFLRKPEEK